MIRTHADVVEADLAFRGIDFRDLWRKGSGLTPRRLLVLVRALPPDSLTHLTLDSAPCCADAGGTVEQKTKPTLDQHRERLAHYDRMIRGGE